MKIDEVIEKLKSDAIIDSYNFQGYSMKQKEEIIEWLEELKMWRTSFVNENIKNDFANRSTLLCHNCDHKDEYIIELEIGLKDALKTVRETKEITEEIVRKLDSKTKL